VVSVVNAYALGLVLLAAARLLMAGFSWQSCLVVSDRTRFLIAGYELTGQGRVLFEATPPWGRWWIL
jgi:hypothetical protein